jgi:hypothetical protein
MAQGQGIWMAEIREILIPKTWFAGYRSGEVHGCSRERRTELKTRPQLLLSVLLDLIAGAPAFAQKYKTISRRRSPFLTGLHRGSLVERSTNLRGE